MEIITNPKKSLGQNFLMDKNIINKIIEIGKINKNKTILEIGPGYGSLTTEIASRNPKRIIAVEKDIKLVFYLKKKFENHKNIKIINYDFLKIIEKNNLGQNLIVFGNLPYNISTKILASLIMLKKWPPWYDQLIFMFQKEVADRIMAKYKTKDYGRLSVLSNWRLEVKKHFNISKNCFFPRPKINSTLLSFKPIKNNKFNLKNPKTLENVTRILFSNRRKMINKNFYKLFKNKIPEKKKLKIDLSKRPEELNNEVFYEISRQYEKLFD
jgi:16S rRNA (adenine1518-N6/adenine1519-N6)-dimethyltransferase